MSCSPAIARWKRLSSRPACRVSTGLMSAEDDHEIRFDAASVVINGNEQTIAYYEDAF